ncbi:hypothetical protein E1A91_A06G082500v1 [Gossypium mustelinum]|uniref:F-box/LRR-repeat protein 15-like leucin rich repeat domain-containing protein n=1 Tax=Gossypium mustelinum TaxID=34275 RepID=A0A5D2YUW5_GOSMU|nr:hypothetical protein E1A91_A06G082500v1 [Gossypium mustelinum]
MPVLRSREILPVQPKPLKARANIDPPATPTQGREQPATRSSPPSLIPSPKTLGSVSGSAPILRRSLRLSTKASSNAGQDGVLEAEEPIERRNGDVSRKRKLSADNDVGLESGEDEGVLSLRSGKRVTKKGPFGDGNGSEGDVEVEIDRKGKSMLVEESEDTEKPERSKERVNVKGKRRYSREEKGKGKLLVESALESKDESLVDGSVSDVELLAQEVNLSNEKPSKKNNRRTSQGRMERFRDTARENASRFAHFNTQEEDDNILSTEAESEIPSEEPEEKGVEDWPGPFSTAMKIIRDRAANFNVRQGSSSSDKVQYLQIKWVPQKGKRKDWSKRLPPSLLDLSLRVLVDNADAIASLAHVPDALRHKLCHILCDSRRMNSNFFDLLLNGSPIEIRLKDCSWLTEEQFNQCFEKSDTINLTILQLDYCGHCLADYSLPSTLARSPNSLPALTTLSLTGAYRLSDAGLSALVSSAPALRSVNLSQCSFLTHSAIDILATSLASVLLELFIDDCQSIDAMLVLPSLKKLEHLEVLSVAGLESVTDSFIKEFLIARGDGIKELILMDCWKLTDSSLKIIAETCSNLRALDIGNISKLTDTSFGYLASGCRSLQSLKLCRNAFSDDAIAAFLEMSGEVLKELALNNVGKVGLNTALSLARRSRNLVSLDLSWCRNLTDEALGLIVDSCLSLRVLKLFGCSQITDVFLYGHSNAKVEIIGLKLSPLLEHIKTPAQGPLQYSSVSDGCQ